MPGAVSEKTESQWNCRIRKWKTYGLHRCFINAKAKSGSRFTGWLLQAEHRLVTSEEEVTKNSCLKNGEIREWGWERVFEVITKSKKLGRKEVAGNIYSTNRIDVASSKRACFAHYRGYWNWLCFAVIWTAYARYLYKTLNFWPLWHKIGTTFSDVMRKRRKTGENNKNPWVYH